MKTRTSFVSNSSSTSFVITNTSDTPKTLVDFVVENKHLLDEFLDRYDWYKDDANFNLSNMIKDAEESPRIFNPHKQQICTFGDHDQTTLGTCYDYILRDGGESANFRWSFFEYNR